MEPCELQARQGYLMRPHLRVKKLCVCVRACTCVCPLSSVLCMNLLF